MLSLILIHVLNLLGDRFFDVLTIPKGSDLYMINGVLHDWSDEECITILNNTRMAMKPGGTIVIMDLAVDPSSALYNAQTRLDVFMMAISTGWFRTVEEYNTLWPKSGLKLKQLIKTRSINLIWELVAQ